MCVMGTSLALTAILSTYKLVDQPIIDRNSEPRRAHNHEVEWHASAMHRVMKHGDDIG